jgi:hypothetical protein
VGNRTQSLHDEAKRFVKRRNTVVGGIKVIFAIWRIEAVSTIGCRSLGTQCMTGDFLKELDHPPSIMEAQNLDGRVASQSQAFHVIWSRYPRKIVAYLFE